MTHIQATTRSSKGQSGVKSHQDRPKRVTGPKKKATVKRPIITDKYVPKEADRRGKTNLLVDWDRVQEKSAGSSSRNMYFAGIGQTRARQMLEDPFLSDRDYRRALSDLAQASQVAYATERMWCDQCLNTSRNCTCPIPEVDGFSTVRSDSPVVPIIHRLMGGMTRQTDEEAAQQQQDQVDAIRKMAHKQRRQMRKALEKKS